MMCISTVNLFTVYDCKVRPRHIIYVNTMWLDYSKGFKKRKHAYVLWEYNRAFVNIVFLFVCCGGCIIIIKTFINESAY